MAKYTIGEICEKLDILTSTENRLREGRECDLEEVADLLSEYADMLLGIRVDVNAFI